MKQGVVIQGPTTYFKEIADSWSGWPNVVWSTWLTEPKENMDYIKSKGIDVFQSNEPAMPGDINVNYQVLSTYNGLNFLHIKGVTEVLKIRSDHHVNDIKTLLEILQGRRMSFLAMANIEIRRDIKYNLGGIIHEGHDYPSDNIIYGKMEDMLQMFNFQTDQNYNVPPEALILYNYLSNMGYQHDFTYDYLKSKGITFFEGECFAKGIKINWFKKGWELVHAFNSEYYKF